MNTTEYLMEVDKCLARAQQREQWVKDWMAKGEIQYAKEAADSRDEWLERVQFWTKEARKSVDNVVVNS